MKSCDVSVIIPAYCSEKFIFRAIESVLSQTVLPNEIIIIDDGSTDNTISVLNGYIKKSTNVKIVVLSQSHKGPGAARNLGLRHSHSKYIAFLDSDDEWLPKKLQISVQFLEQENYDLVAHNVIMVTEKKQTRNDIAARYKKAKHALFFGLYCKGFIGTSTVIAPLSVIREAGFFDEKLPAGQDFDLWLKILGKKNCKMLVFDDYLTRNYIRPASITRNVDNRLRCTLTIARRHASKIRQFGRSSLRGLSFRVVAVHYEAFKGYLSNRQLLAAVSVTLKVLPTLFIETAHLIATIIKEYLKRGI